MSEPKEPPLNTERTSPDHHVAIIGCGFGGLGTAIQLDKAGIHDYVIFERASEVGGTWQANTYPGAQCDIPSIIYSFSFAPNPNWSRLYPLQSEIKDYLHKCAVDFGVLPHVRFNTEVQDASWDDAAQLWRLRTTEGETTARILVGAIGPFSEPAVPNFPGQENFKGTLFHSTTWDHDHDLTGERVAVIGTGASAVQFIPRVQPIASELTVFQRTATWILPHPDRPLGVAPKTIFGRIPPTQWAARQAMSLFQESLVPGFVYEPKLQKGLETMARAHLRHQVKDPVLREKLTPKYAVGCKRPTFSNKYYPALSAPNTEVVTEGITEFTERGIRTVDDIEHEFDTIICGTGFRMSDHPGFNRVHGRDGQSIGDHWSDGNLQAYLGTTVHNFPNFFMILGPNSAAYTSAVITIEAQVAYIMAALKAMKKQKLSSIEVSAKAQQDFVEWTDKGLEHSVWNTGGCSSYYLSKSGRNFSFWPGFAAQYKARTSSIKLADYITR